MVEKVESSYGASPGVFNIWRHRFILLAAHLYSFSVARFSFPLVLFSHMCVPVRLVRRLVMSSRCASRLVRPVASCRPSSRRVVRLAVSSARLGVSFRMGTVSLCCSLVLVSPVVVSLPCVLGSSRFRLGIPSRPCVSSIVSSAHLVISRHLVSVSPVGVSDPFSCLAPVFAPFRSAVRSFLFAYPVSVHVLGRGAGLCCYGHRAGAACSCIVISSVPSLLPTRYSLTRCGMVAGGCGIWGTVPCCSPLVPCLFMSPRSSSSHRGSPSLSYVLIPSPTKQESRGRRTIERERKNKPNRNETHDETKRETRRWWRRDDTGWQASNETPDETEGTRRETRRHLMRTDGRRRGEVSHAALF